MKYNIDYLKGLHRTLERDEFLFFWGHTKKDDEKMTKACFSQWFVAPFEIDGVTYPTAEHYMMAEKARLFNDNEQLALIIQSKTPKEAKAFGRKVKGFDNDLWSQHRERIVCEGNRAKFAQHADLKAFLLNTGNQVIVEASPVDDVWGVGLAQDSSEIIDVNQWKGLNLLGFALMEVRDALRCEPKMSSADSFDKQIAILGFGRMGYAVAHGLVRYGQVPGMQIHAIDNHIERLRSSCDYLGIHSYLSPDMFIALEKVDWIILAVRPNQVESVLKSIPNDLLKDKVIISVAGGYHCDHYDALLGSKQPHISIIPNTPIKVGEGVVIVEERHTLDERTYVEVRSLFERVALFQPVPTRQLDVAVVLASCSPAYVAMMLESFGEVGVKYGLNRELSHQLAAKMLCGVGRLFLDDHEHPVAMKEAVCSPGGTTIRGVVSLEQSGFRASLIDALSAAIDAHH